MTGPYVGTFGVRRGASPLVVSMPHAGTWLPDEARERMTPSALELPDTDWGIPVLYDFLREVDATVIEARASRYWIDLNRDPDGSSLYPGRPTTELVPHTQFDGSPIYLEGMEPDRDDLAIRMRDAYDPYHTALNDVLGETVARHGVAVLWDAHSIRSRVPRLFEGTLPDLNLGTWCGRSCAPEVEDAVARVMEESPFSSVVNGRFTGGWITRHHGRPDEGVHAVQMEIALSACMEEAHPWAVDEVRAARLRPVLRRMMAAAVEAASALSPRTGP